MSTWLIAYDESPYLCHHGIKGQKWGIRRYQNEDGTLTEEGKQRYGTVENLEKAMKRKKIARNVAIGVGGTAAAVGGALLIGNAIRNGKIDRQRRDAKIEQEREWAKEAFWEPEKKEFIKNTFRDAKIQKERDEQKKKFWATEIKEHDEKVEKGRSIMKELFWDAQIKDTEARAKAAGIPDNVGPANFMGGPRKKNGGRNVRVVPR